MLLVKTTIAPSPIHGLGLFADHIREGAIMHTSFDVAPFIERRQRFAEAIQDGLAIIPGAQEVVRNHDVHYAFRQNSDFFFLTGFDEPDAVALINPASATERFVLFVRPQDREREMWTGRRAGPEGAMAIYGADAAYPIEQFGQKLREYAIDRAAVYYRLGNAAYDAQILQLLTALRPVRTRGHTVPSRIEDPDPILHELRLRRSLAELVRHRRACEIARAAHTEAMRYAQPGMHEYEVQAALEFIFRRHGSPRNGYPSIVASGPNACILHYTENNRRLEDGDLVLIDAGCEYGYYAADITRTFPVNGRFTAAQRLIYDIVLQAQLTAIDAAKPGNRYEAIHDAARRVLTEGLVALGLLPRSVDESLAMHHYRAFYPHSTGHWLGMDVHDVGDYRVHRQSRVLEPGMVLTVEPGLYFDPERERATYYLRAYSDVEMRERRDQLGMAAARKLERAEKEQAQTITHPIAQEFRGIGIRIEDDVLITEHGNEVLTQGTPKTLEEVEQMCAEASRLPR
jgi:Xaa-Pro aminopeptidase